MSKNKFKARQELMSSILELSEADTWDEAVREWDVVDCDEDLDVNSSCVCGQSGIRFLFTIENKNNGNTLYPIGRLCIKKFGREEMNSEAAMLEKLYLLAHAVDQGNHIYIDSTYYSRAFIEFLFERGAFMSNGYDGCNAYGDYAFIRNMFNARSWTDKQLLRSDLIIRERIAPFAIAFLPKADPSVDSDLKERFFKLLSAVHNRKPFAFNDGIFTYRLIEYLHTIGAFRKNKYNEWDGYNDCRFLQEMLIARERTEKQKKKMFAILSYSVLPFLWQKLKAA